MTQTIAYGHCHCGCGQKTLLATGNRTPQGWIKGEPKPYLVGHNRLFKRGPAVDPGKKWCGSCQTVKLLSDFAVNSNQVDGLQGFCRPCGRAKQTAWREKNRAKSNALATRSHRHKRIGIEYEEYELLLRLHENKCAICKREETTQHRGLTRALAVDHCHESGRIRGLLCNNCNRGLGLFDDSKERIASALEYMNQMKS